MTLPPALPGLDPASLAGRWHIAATTLSFWRGRSDATVEYSPRPDGRWTDTLRFRKGVTERALVGVDTPLRDRPGFFRWRGAGWLAWCTSTWGFVLLAPDARWAVTWFSRATLGVTPEGMDVYGRAPLSQGEIDAAIAQARARPDLPRLDGWFSIPRAP